VKRLLMLIGALALFGFPALAQSTLYYTQTTVLNANGSVTVTPTASMSWNNDDNWCNPDDGCTGSADQCAVMVNGNTWVVGPVDTSDIGCDAEATFPSVTIAAGSSADLSYAGKVEGATTFATDPGSWDDASYDALYTDLFSDGWSPNIPPQFPCFIATSCPNPLPDLWVLRPAGYHPVDMGSQLVAQVLPIPTSETTYYYGNYQITEGSFVMALNPGTLDFDGFYVNEFDYAQGTNTCWWPGANFVQYPSVVGSYWTVGQNGSAHDQYGLDSIGFPYPTVSTIQSQAPEHDIDFPCVVTIYQEMTYDLFYDYAENKDTQTIGSTTVQVCRTPQVCTPVIQF